MEKRGQQSRHEKVSLREGKRKPFCSPWKDASLDNGVKTAKATTCLCAAYAPITVAVPGAQLSGRGMVLAPLCHRAGGHTQPLSPSAPSATALARFVDYQVAVLPVGISGELAVEEFI